MVIRIKRPYLTFSEVAERLHVPAESTDMRRIVLTGVLRPRLILRGEMARAVPSDGSLVPLLDAGGAPTIEPVEGWVYPQWPMQSAPFEATYAAASRVANPTDADELWLWPGGPTVSDLIADAVVAEEDLCDAEAVLGAGGDLVDPAKPNPKRQNSIAKLITVMAAGGYGWDRNAARSDTVAEIVSDGARLGIDIARGTVLELLRQAWDASPPAMPAKAAREVERGQRGGAGAQRVEAEAQT